MHPSPFALPLPGPGTCPLGGVTTRTELGDWRFADLPAPWLLLVLAAVVFVGLRWLYRRERGRSAAWARVLLTGLRTLVLLAIVLLLAGPYREEVRTAEEKSHLVVLIDTSASMRNEDAYSAEEEARLLAAAWPEGEGGRPARLSEAPDPSRLGLVKRLLAAGAGRALARLSERFLLHVHAFDEDWRTLGTTEPPAEDAREEAPGLAAQLEALQAAVAGLEARGPRTRIGAALRSVATQYLGRPDQPLAGVVLVTDGQDTSEGETPLEVLAALPGAHQLRVHAVALGNPDSDRNLRVDKIRAKDVVLARDRVPFETALRHKGFAGVGPVRAEMTVERIVDAEGRRLDPPQPLPLESDARARASFSAPALPPEDVPLPVRLETTFDEPGTYRIRIRGSLPASHERQDAVRDDNVEEHELLVRDESIRVLFVDREPRHDWRFLSNYLTREAPGRPTAGGGPARSRFLTHVLLQTADPTVDPPYTRSPGMGPRRRFPQTREELFAYDVLLLGDVDFAALATPSARKNEVLGLIRSFVEEGGGLMLQAGIDLKNPLGMLGTPLADLLPIAAAEADRNATESAMPRREPFRLRLTEVGAAHPAFHLFERDGSGEVPSSERVARIWAGEDPDTPVADHWSWYWAYRCLGGLRPGAVALATAFRPGTRDERGLVDGHGRPLVVFASMGFGRGRVFWSAIDDVARIRREHGDAYYGAFWEQVIRELALYRLLGGDRRFKIFPKEEEVEVGQTAEVLILAQDDRYRPLETPYLDGVHVELPDGAGRIDLEGEARPEATSRSLGGPPGEYLFRLPVTRPGTYLVWIEQSADGRSSGERAERRFKAVTRAREDALKLPDHRLLEGLARETRGQLLRPSQLGELSLPTQAVTRVLNRERQTQWDKAWVLFVLVGLLGLEWALRKRFQMI